MSETNTPEAPLRCDDSRLAAALQYVLDNSGKQLRARLVMTTYRMLCDGVEDAADSAATAIEWLHTYSLVHDDLPAMDNDDLRRGKPTVHTVYDEATAILIGDGLQAAAFALISEDARLSSDTRLKLIALISNAVGFRGMVGGQALDMAAEGQASSFDQLRLIHEQKTGALIRAAVLSGAICANATEDDMQRLDPFARTIGLAFQVADDILDVTQNSSTLGKTAGKDVAVEKSTYVRCLGLEGARDEADKLLADALACLSPYGERAQPLQDLAVAMVRREH
jgi:geranylgeranyl pyrophosphate synthase